MATKPVGKNPKPNPAFALGDSVEILHFGRGKVTALRGPLGPGGEQVYRVRYRRKPTAAYIEVLASQIRLAKSKKGAAPSAAHLAPGVVAPGG